jgi:hypothetical protein
MEELFKLVAEADVEAISSIRSMTIDQKFIPPSDFEAFMHHKYRSGGYNRFVHNMIDICLQVAHKLKDLQILIQDREMEINKETAESDGFKLAKCAPVNLKRQIRKAQHDLANHYFFLTLLHAEYNNNLHYECDCCSGFDMYCTQTLCLDEKVVQDYFSWKSVFINS